MKKSQFLTLATILYLGIGLIFTQTYDQGSTVASHGQPQFNTGTRFVVVFLWPIMGTYYIIYGYTNNYSAYKN
jgi:hypothetical protein